MTTAGQDTLPFEVRTPLGPDRVSLKSMTGEERISGLYRYTLELAASDNSIDLSKIAGKGITVCMPRPDGTDQYLHGIVGRFTYAGAGLYDTTYRAELYPELWLLTLSSNCRIFQNKTTEQIIDHVLKEAGITSVIKRLSGAYKPRDFCVQYRETNFDFISRLMEEDGIFYFFEHDNDKHTLVLGDNFGAYGGGPEPNVIYWRTSHAGWTDEETIAECSFEEQPVTGRYKTSDYNFEMPDTDLFSAIGAEASKQEIYEYPANALSIDELEAKSKRMLECIESSRRILRGTSACRALRAGVRFTFAGHSRLDLNADYVVRRISLRAEKNGSFTSTFEAQPASAPFRPARTTPRPCIHGTQTATVVGKQGDDIMTDGYGRVRVHFHWDRTGKRNETASCPVRVAQVWAGKKWGALFVPRVGQEVVVSFLDGNPDRPIIIGSVYNAAQPAPYDPGAAPTRSSIKSNSSKGGGGSNEIRFDDKKEAEELYLHAQKNLVTDVVADAVAKIGHDEITKIGNEQTITVKKDRTITVDEGDETVVIKKGDRDITLETGDEWLTVKGSRTLSVGAEETHETKADYTLTVDGNFVLNVKGNITINTENGSITIKGNNIANHAKQGLVTQAGTIQNNAEQTIVTKAGISQNLEGAVSVNIKAALVKLN